MNFNICMFFFYKKCKEQEVHEYNFNKPWYNSILIRCVYHIAKISDELVHLNQLMMNASKTKTMFSGTKPIKAVWKLNLRDWSLIMGKGACKV